jgi:hypothetical protein
LLHGAITLLKTIESPAKDLALKLLHLILIQPKQVAATPSPSVRPPIASPEPPASTMNPFPVPSSSQTQLVFYPISFLNQQDVETLNSFSNLLSGQALLEGIEVDFFHSVLQSNIYSRFVVEWALNYFFSEDLFYSRN